MERDDRLRRRREHDGQRRAQESREERDEATTAVYTLIIIVIVFRLARRREYDRARRAAMIPEERKTARQVRRDRRAAALREPPSKQQADRQTIPPHAEPQPSNHSTLEIDHPVTQMLYKECRTFTEVYQIYRMRFVICARNVSQQLTQ